MQRVKTGIEGLDQLLYGGFLEGDAVLVAGTPGTGKTSLGMQYLYNGVTKYDEPGFFVTFEEFPAQIYRDGLNFGWDFRRLEEENKLKVLFTSPDLFQQDIQRQDGLVPEMIREVGARRVVVDSITHFQRLASDPGQFREIIYGVINALKHMGLTSVLIRELDPQTMSTSEEYIVDAVLYLSGEQVGAERMRYLEIVKSRGSKSSPARSLYFIQDSGLRVLSPYREPFFRYHEAASTGIGQLDDLVGGGIPYGAFYLVELGYGVQQRAFTYNYIKETLAAEDHYVNIDGRTDLGQLEELPAWPELKTMLEQAEKAGRVHYLSALPGERLAESMEEVLRQTEPGRRVRVQMDLSRMHGAQPEAFFPTMNRLTDLNRQYDGVALGILNPRAMDETTLERVRSAADGIVRIWTEGSYNFIQTVKAVNSVRTPISALVEVPDPPYVQLLRY